MSLSSNGGAATLSGILTANGTYSFSILVRDSSVDSFSAQNQITVAPSKLAFTCTNPSGPTQALLPYSNVCTASGGLPPYQFTYQFNGLTVSINGNVVTISGTMPNALTNYSYSDVISVKDGSAPVAQSISQTFSGSIQVVRPIQMVCNPFNNLYLVNGTHPIQCSAISGIPPYHWSISQGSLPAGVSLDQTGLISGTYTEAGPFSFTVLVTDSTLPTAQTQAYALSGYVQAPLTLNCATKNGPIAVGISYSNSCTATGGVPPYRWVLPDGLPSGISLSGMAGATVTFSGTPTMAGSYAYILNAWSNDNSTETGVAFIGTILQLNLNCTSPAGPVLQNQAYSDSCTASGGTPPYQWSIASGSLPAGLFLSTSGAYFNTVAVNGAATSSGQYNYTLRVTDSTTPQLTLAQPFSGSIAGSTPAPSLQSVISASAFGGFTAIAPGSWIEIYGANLAPDTRSWTSADFSGGNAPTTLDGVQVTINGEKAFVSYVGSTPGQVNVQVPSDITVGPASVVVMNNGANSAPFSIQVNSTEAGLLAPASFTVGGNPYVVALLPDYATYVLPTGAISGVVSRPAKPGEAIILYGVGFGPVSPGILPGQIVSAANTLITPLQIFFGGTLAQITYQGLAPGYIGLYQFDVVVPQIPDNNLVPLTFNLGGEPNAQRLFIPVHQ